MILRLILIIFIIKSNKAKLQKVSNIFIIKQKEFKIRLYIFNTSLKPSKFYNCYEKYYLKQNIRRLKYLYKCNIDRTLKKFNFSFFHKIQAFVEGLMKIAHLKTQRDKRSQEFVKKN